MKAATLTIFLSVTSFMATTLPIIQWFAAFGAVLVCMITMIEKQQTMKTLYERFKAETPQVIKWAQLALVTIAGYNVFVSANPDLLKIVPPGYETDLAALSSIAAFLLQFINKKDGPKSNQE